VRELGCAETSSDTLPPMADAFLLSIDLHKLMDHFADTGEPMSF
jgi:hypothetical protein